MATPHPSADPGHGAAGFVEAASGDLTVRAVAAEFGKRRMQIYRWVERFAIDLEAFRT